jgi:hypothetical protein
VAPGPGIQTETWGSPWPNSGRFWAYVGMTLLRIVLELPFWSTKRRDFGCNAGTSSRNGWSGCINFEVSRMVVALLPSQWAPSCTGQVKVDRKMERLSVRRRS